MKKTAYKKQSNTGFTLIELLLYISLSAIMFAGIVSFFAFVIESRSRNNVITEVEQQGIQIMQLITQTARNAESIITPTTGTNDQSLSMNVFDIANNPTTFNVSGDTIYITEGAATPIALSNNTVVITNPIFTNLSRTNTPGVAKIQFTVKSASLGTNVVFDYEKIFYGTASMR